ncbi:cytokine receptor-like isoform X2 [Episyrphus balteatus]|uniref:cytokine receptor-like isoform X2 n=1 Tax=Episyrphus balteatus TaxID=286459 RepID=UPI002485A428|nr:cytokine receptor-like isoform X2 [Episyrphus balteatus]
MTTIVDFEFAKCGLLLRLLFTLLLTMEFTQGTTAHNIFGEVNPAEVEKIAIGANNNITCRMIRRYFNENNSSCLPYYQEQSSSNTTTIPKDQINGVIKPSIKTAKYSCKCDTTDTSIHVGITPVAVIDFECRGYDFNTMACKFTIPENNKGTDYKLIFSTAPTPEKECVLLETNKPSERICNLQNDFRPVICCYKFKLIASNSLGTLTQILWIDLHSKIVPAKPNVEVENLTTNSVSLNLGVEKFSHYKFTDGLKYEIRVHPEMFDSFYISGPLQKKAYKAEINDLPYSYHRYGYSVRVRTVRADVKDETMWSEASEGYFYTKPKRPDRAPKMIVGSFDIDSTGEKIRLYWEELAKHEENGPDFSYNFTEVRCDGKLIKTLIIAMDTNLALLTYKNTSHYTFKLKSQNRNGTSLNSSDIEINPRTTNIPKPEITKIYHQQNQTYTIVWQRPTNVYNLSNFTLLSCVAKTESKTDCLGKINFETIDKNAIMYTTTMSDNRTLNFALSENFENYSTGLSWATCAPEYEPRLGYLSLDEAIISQDSIHLQWTTECWYSSILKEYNLTYCMIESKVGKECIGEIKTLRIPSINNNYVIKGLQPSTSYKIWIRMVSINGEGPATERVKSTTENDNNEIIIGILSLSVLFVILLCWILKEFIRMKNIEYKIPEGLVDFENKPLKTKTNKDVRKTFGHTDFCRKGDEMLLPNMYYYIPRILQRKNNSGDCEIENYVIKPLKSSSLLSVNQEVVSHTITLEKSESPPISTEIHYSDNTCFKPTIIKNSCVEPQAKNDNVVLSSLNGYITPSAIALLSELNPEYITKKQLLDISQSLKFIWLLVITICLATSRVSANDYIGEVIPHHVELPIGGSVNITCRMNRSYFEDNNSSCLSFTRDHGNLMVAKEHIHVVDNSSIVFMIRNATEQTARYTCKCHSKGVYVTNIFVGTPPTNVTDFQCRGYDFSYMTCNFTVPENKIYTDYKLKFSTSSPYRVCKRLNDRKLCQNKYLQDYIYPCNLENGLQTSERICNITMDKNNYRIVYQYYNFELTATNSLGTLTQSIMIDQYNRIVPARPIIEVGNLTTNSVTFYWMVAKFSQYSHTDGLQYEIRLRPEKFDWFYINTNAVLHKNEKDYKAEINNLQYSYRRYDFSVRVKTVRANNSDETMWSEPFVGHFYTKPRRPERAPNMDVGSFYIDPTEQNIRLYWQQLAEYEENGPDFLYNITEVRRDGKLINIMPFQMDSTSATYEWQRTSHYQFKLQSQNNVGSSLNTSILEVHPSRKRPLQIEQIQVITKVYHNQTYTITWRQPSDMENLRNFTLFWCISKMESQSQCKGTINFKHFDKYTTNHTTEPQNHTLNFAVSANYETYSTGMMWAMCTADGATDLTKMDPETTPISSNSIKVQWSTECLYMAILEGYNLTYCKVDNHAPEMIGNCIDSEKTISISKLAKEHIITELEPFTTYKISILMYSKLKIGPMSNPVTATTTEDAPSPPRKLKKYNVTSDSVTLSWLPPKHSNGNLRYYTVWYKNEGTIVNSTSNDNGSEITFQLGSLSSYSDYKVYVTAHTVKSSVPSNDIHFKTLIGIPSPPLSFNMNRNDKELFFSWSPPKLPSGRVEFYEIRVTVRKNNESETLKTSRVVGRFCKMNIPCYDPKNSYIFDVRAVNVAERSEVDYHTFSKRDTSTSYFNSLHRGAAKKRRHSNAEINASIGAPYQIHETTEKNLRHRHERENLKLMQITEPSYVSQLSSQIPEEAQDDSNEDFICIGGEREALKILSQYKDATQYKLFYSLWQNGPFFACSETKFSKLTMLALVVIVVTMLLLATVYYARKKYNKMSSIGLVIPEGLDDNINVAKGVDNKIGRDDIIRSDELFYEKENHRLLSKVGNDSGFLNSVHCLDKTSGYACSDLQDSEKSSQSTDSVELNDITSCSYTSSPSHSPNANLRETATIPEDRSNPPIIQPSVQIRPSENGYIKPIMMSNGYVQPQAFQQLQQQPKETPSFNGYTTLDAMGKPIFPQTSTAAPAPIAAERSSYEIVEPKNNANNKDIGAIQHPVSGNICGYVTHKQLSDFGQRLQ